ncbi:MAG: ATP phosphoribosyltransferase [Mariniblastus sp.]|nr:ATP phosphoribosyltransferase [Mariniblastus sp.]
MNQPIKIGIPSKGRLAEQATSLLNQAGLSFRRQNRSLFARVSQLPIDIAFLRTDDIPILCDEGAIDLGITGQDLVEESQATVTQRLRLGVGNCRLSICVPSSFQGGVGDLKNQNIATSFPNTTHLFLAEHNTAARIVELSGSVEVMIQLGVADAIVDLVETGSTLAANDLKILCDIGTYETVLIQRKGLDSNDLVNRVVRRLEGVVIARSYSLLEFNIARDLLKQAEAITPGFDSPTVSALEDETMCAVRVMVSKREIIEKMEHLESLGASAIIQVPISNCRL